MEQKNLDKESNAIKRIKKIPLSGRIKNDEITQRMGIEGTTSRKAINMAKPREKYEKLQTNKAST